VYWVHWEDYDLKHDIWKSLKHLNHTSKLLESYHYMYFNKFHFIIIIIQDLFHNRNTIQTDHTWFFHSITYSSITVKTICCAQLMCMRKCFMKCTFVCEKHSNDSLLIQNEFCWEKLISLWEKELNRAVWDVLHERRILSDVMTE
jgi:hypothetical protein